MKKILFLLICLFCAAGLAPMAVGEAYFGDDAEILSSPPPPAPEEIKKEEPPPPPAKPKYPPVEIKTGVDGTKFIGNQNLVFRIEVIFNQGVNPFWEKLTQLDLSPFRIEKITLGERKMHERDKDLARDVREAIFLLSLPASSERGIYVIPAFSLDYSYFEGEKEITGAVKSKSVEVKKVPVLATVAAEKDVLTIGEVNILRLVIWRESSIKVLNHELKERPDIPEIEKEGFRRWLKSLEVRNQKISDLQKPEFPNFKILAKSFRTEIQESIVKEIFEYRFAFYELGGREFNIPSFHIWYLDESETETRKPREIVTPAQDVKINLIVREGRQSLEGLKTPPPPAYSKKNIYLYGYGPLAMGSALILIFAAGIGRELVFRRKNKPTGPIEIRESPAKIWHSLSNLEKAKVLNHPRVLIQIRNEFSKMLAGILGIPVRRVLSQSGPEMADLFRKAGFREELAEDLENCLKSLDRAIQNPESLDEYSAIWTRINGIVQKPEISRFLKKRKKFLVF